MQNNAEVVIYRPRVRNLDGQGQMPDPYKQKHSPKYYMRVTFIIKIVVLFLLPCTLSAQLVKDDSFIAENYTKMETMITMRDGVRLFTSIYIPKDEKEKYPFLIRRTPYSCAPYGEKNLSKYPLGPNRLLMQEKYIFVSQDVRGRYKSEGQFEEMTPAISNKSGQETDESSDTYDTVEWLLKNIKNNNGKVGIYGISYDGFYASASLPDAHPAIKAVSPQAPMSDEFIGDDTYHNGAFQLIANFDFSNYFLGERTDSGTNYNEVFKLVYKNAYSFFMGLEPLKNTNSSLYFKNKAKIWNEYLQHNVYDDYWQARNIRKHLKNIKPAVLVVGGWFDAEDLFGSLKTFEAIKEQSPENKNVWLVMGPWSHGEWGIENQFQHANYVLADQNPYYHEEIETKFFNYYLKNKGDFKRPQATVFNTGTGKWKEYASWPAADTKPRKLYLQEGGKISDSPSPVSFDEYVSDPANPVPYAGNIRGSMDPDYMTGDQRFASERKDVLVYNTAPLSTDLTITGEMNIDLFISTTGTDADFIVKIIDVLPDGIQRLQRAEVFRSKFRKSFTVPEALIPGKVSEVEFNLNDITHTFIKGHRLMIQVQSSWFPLADINPQKFVDISNCEKSDFQKATIRVYHNSSITLPVTAQ